MPFYKGDSKSDHKALSFTPEGTKITEAAAEYLRKITQERLEKRAKISEK